MQLVKMTKGKQAVEVRPDEVPTMLNRGYKEDSGKEVKPASPKGGKSKSVIEAK
tara:strand:- start:1026 stop:1187 length:162 start_codon:yes stop_codon:yes gene_type:complete